MMPIYGGEAAGTEASPKQVVQRPGKCCYSTQSRVCAVSLLTSTMTDTTAAESDYCSCAIELH